MGRVKTSYSPSCFFLLVSFYRFISVPKRRTKFSSMINGRTKISHPNPGRQYETVTFLIEVECDPSDET